MQKMVIVWGLLLINAGQYVLAAPPAYNGLTAKSWVFIDKDSTGASARIEGAMGVGINPSFGHESAFIVSSVSDDMVYINGKDSSGNYFNCSVPRFISAPVNLPICTSTSRLGGMLRQGRCRLPPPPVAVSTCRSMPDCLKPAASGFFSTPTPAPTVNCSTVINPEYDAARQILLSVNKGSVVAASITRYPANGCNNVVARCSNISVYNASYTQ